MKLILTIFILLSASVSSFAQNKVITKATIFRSGYFVTFNSKPEELENIVNEAFSKKGYQILKSLESDSNTFFVDLFVFQSAGENPAIVLTLRTVNGIHYIDKELIKVFIDRDWANRKLASNLAERLPALINTKVCYKLTFKDIFTSNLKKIRSENISNLTNETKTKYSAIINWGDNNSPDFIFRNEFESYFSTVFDYREIRKQLKGQLIRIKLKINNSAKFEVVEILSPESLTPQQQDKILEAIKSFPLWIVQKQMENIELKFVVL